MKKSTVTIYYDHDCILCKTSIFCMRFDPDYTIRYVNMRNESTQIPPHLTGEDGFIVQHDGMYYQGLVGIEKLSVILKKYSIFRTISRTMSSIPILGKSIYASMKILRKVLLKIQGKQSL